MAFWSLRESPPPRIKLTIELVGACLFICGWWTIAWIWTLPRSVLPTPWDVARTFPILIQGHAPPLDRPVLWHVWQSIQLNLLSYLEAVVIAIPLGFLIGLFGPIKALTEREMAGFRYLPITAFTSVLITWFGISTLAKVQFLSLGVIVYLLPAVIQRILEVPQIYVDTAKTSGATRWQRIKTVFWPMVSGPLSEDCKNLLPITWTYLVVAEGFNMNEGGLGALILTYGRAARFDFVFALVFLILLIGFCQDKLWTSANRYAFPWLYR